MTEPYFTKAELGWLCAIVKSLGSTPDEARAALDMAPPFVQNEFAADPQTSLLAIAQKLEGNKAGTKPTPHFAEPNILSAGKPAGSNPRPGQDERE